MKKTKILSLITLSFAFGILSACNASGENGKANDSGKTKEESGERQDEHNSEIKHEHTFEEAWQKNESQHWHAATCEHTEEKGSLGNHEFGDGNVCSVCGYEKEIQHEHTYATEWSKDFTGHWHAATCEHTSEKSNFGSHTYGEGDICTVCNYEKPATELRYFVNSDTNGVKIDEDRGFAKTPAIALKVNETIKFADVFGTSVVDRTGFTIEGDANGFTINNGILKAGYEASYIFELNEGKITIKPNNMANPFKGVIYAGGQHYVDSPFRFKCINGANSCLEYKITNAEIPQAPFTITLQIEKNDAVIAIDSLLNTGAGADFTLSQDKKTLTYVGAGNLSYDFLLVENYTTNAVTLSVALHA